MQIRAVSCSASALPHAPRCARISAEPRLCAYRHTGGLSQHNARERQIYARTDPPLPQDHTAADRDFDGIRHFLWDNRSNQVGWTAYLGQAPASPEAPQ